MNGFFVFICFDWWGAFEHLEQVTSGAGKSLTSATGGGIMALPLRTTVANILTVGLAGLPVLAISTIDAMGTIDAVQTSPVVAVTSAAAVASPAVGEKAASWAIWVDRCFPWAVLMTSIVNWWVYYLAKNALSMLWVVIYRYLPALVLLPLLWVS